MSRTILLTGITGFIAKRIALDLLAAGYAVRGSLRSAGRAEEVRAALRPHLSDPDALERLTFVEADLASDTGWAEAVDGMDAVLHTASPFPMAQPRDEEEVIRPAVDGALRALRAAQAAGVTRFVITSSMAAVMYKDIAPGQAVSEADWSEADHATMTPYAKSKLLAEKAAWNFASEHPEMQLTAINPGLVAGPPVDARWGTSLGIIEQMVTGKMPAIPNFGLPVVDIRDVSTAHVRALERDASIGSRFVLADRYMMAPEIADVLRAAHPGAKVPKRRAPKWMMRLMAPFDSTARAVLPILDLELDISNDRTREMLGIAFIPAEDSIRASADAILARG